MSPRDFLYLLCVQTIYIFLFYFQISKFNDLRMKEHFTTIFEDQHPFGLKPT